MKKLFALILCMVLLMPAALAEAPVVLDAGDFTMQVNPGDAYELYEKAEGAVMLALYTVDTGDETFLDNVNVAWTAEDTTAMDEASLEAMGNLIMEQAKLQYDELGVATDNYQLLSFELVAGENGFIIYSYDIDYSALGVDHQATIYQYQIFFMDGAEGTYICTATSDSIETLAVMGSYGETFQLK